MDPKIVVKFKRLDIDIFSIKLKEYLNYRFKGLLNIKENKTRLLIEYKNNDYHLELPIFFEEDEIFFHSHLWKIDAGDISGFGSFLQHLIKAWIYFEFKLELEKPEKTDLDLNHFKFKNYNNWEKYILKNRSFLYKLLIKLNNPVPKELTKL